MSRTSKRSSAQRTVSEQAVGRSPKKQTPVPTRALAPKRGQPFPIVGVGASAGGLEAYTRLLKRFPADANIALVLIQHLDPAHESELSRLLSKHTQMPTCEVTNNLRVEPDHVYVIPPNVNMVIADGVLRLAPRVDGRKPQHAIDRFFESLAEDQHERAIGVILSGTASDGTIGLEAIKAEGGITFAQDESAKYDSMPRSAVAAGCVDFVFSPEEIAEELPRIAKHPYVVGSLDLPEGDAAADASTPTQPEADRMQATRHEHDDTPLPSGGHGAPPVGARKARAEAARGGALHEGEGIKKILMLLRNHSGVDFSLYKSSTIQRRIARRMALGKYDTFDDYARFLRTKTRELDTLFSDVLISVTSFFRNPEAFAVLESVVLPKLIKRRSGEVRVWVLGCSTGQEAYSVAMAYAEAAAKAARAPTLQIFATDLNDVLLEKARSGLYAKTLAGDISPERLRRFFVEEEGGYRVVKSIRDSVVFARQNMISDPPFSRMDLICCRNLLIYLEPSLQQKAIPTFHYALKPEGFLFLGASESVGPFTDLFETVDKRHKIFAKKPVATPAHHLPIPRLLPADKKRPIAPPHRYTDGVRTELSAQREADRVTVNEFAPPGVLINDAMQILQFRGPTAPYLTPPSGKATFDVLKMAHEGLMLPLRAAINKCRKENKVVRNERVRVNEDGSSREVSLQVIPLKNLKERSYLILFEEPTADRRSRRGEPSIQVDKEASPTAATLRHRLIETERELAETRDYVQAIQDQYDAATEELQASNEEAQSSNEELQSINEEIETSKEELESTNEELTTVNEEMNNRNAELSRANADLNNLHVSIHTAIVVLGRDLTVRRFTPLAEKAFNLLATDVGRSITRIRHDLTRPVPPEKGRGESRSMPFDLEGMVRDVIDTISVRDAEVLDRRGSWFLLRVRPYMTLDNKIDGAVIALVDIDAVKRSEQAAHAARVYAETILRSMPMPLLVLNSDLRVQTANEAFYRGFQVDPHRTEGLLVYELGNRQWNIPALRSLLENVLPQNSFFENFEVTHEFESIGVRTVRLNARRLDSQPDTSGLILLVIEDITQRKRSEDALRASEERFRTGMISMAEGLYIVDTQGVVTYVNPAAEGMFGWTAAELIGTNIHDVIHPTHPDGTPSLASEWPGYDVLQTGIPLRSKEDNFIRKDGTFFPVVFSASPLKKGETTIGLVVAFRDNTEYKRNEERLRASAERFRVLAETVPEKIFTATPEGVIDYFSPQWVVYTGSSPDALRAQGEGRIIHPDDVEASIAAWREAVRTGQAFHFEQRLQRVDGEYRWHDTHAVPLKDAKGGVQMWVGASSDIQNLKESDQRKDEFLAVLAHELRNPLAPINNALHILRRTGDVQSATPAVDMLQRQVGHVTRLVDDLLDVSRISRDTIGLQLERVDLVPIVKDAVEEARTRFAGKRQQLTVDTPDEPLFVDADVTRLMQIVGNLLNNASKFTEHGGSIRVGIERNATEASISVRDSGIGIAPEQLSRIFDMFVQVDTSLERMTGGLGIGLTLVKKLVTMHGGTVEAQSLGIGHGSEFIVRLPLQNEGRTRSRDAPESVPTSIVPRRILVVDDNIDAASSMSDVLELWGHQVHMAHDGLAAVKAVESFEPDVILLDIGLPKLNGYDAARRIRKRHAGEELLIIALTGYGQEEDKRRSTEAGIDFHLVKPVDLRALETIMADHGPARSGNRAK